MTDAPSRITDQGEDYIRADLVPAWQPIETAPKDEAVLLFSQISGPAVQYWRTFCIYNQPKFTHWMPLPPQPTKGGAS